MFLSTEISFYASSFKKKKSKSIHLITRMMLAEHVKAAGDTRDTFRHCQSFTACTSPGRRQIKHRRCLLRSAQVGVAEPNVRDRDAVILLVRKRTANALSTDSRCCRCQASNGPSEMEMSGSGSLAHAGITRRRQQTEG